jgi:acyl-CoA synthetase (NDP forming)
VVDPSPPELVASGQQSALNRLLRPRSLAVVGAAPPPSLSANLLANLEQFSYSGVLHLVSRSRTEIDGRPCLRTIEDLPTGVDAAALMLPEPAVAEAVAACARRGVGGVMVFASGYGEVGPQGRQRQEEIAATARSAGMALLGPNCLGIVNFADGIPLTFEPLEPHRPGGRGVCVIAQSGAMAGNIRMALIAKGLPVAYAISTGNEALIGAEDFIDTLLVQPTVGLFALFVEQIRQPQRFLRLVAQARALGKPVVLMHPGRSARARAAASTHTGALAGDHAVMRAFVEQAGVVLVESLDELFDTSALLVRYPHPSGLGLAVLSNSGAIRGFALDFCVDLDLPLPSIGEETSRALAAVLPDFATIDNPLDLTAQGMQKPSLFADCARALLDDPAIGALLVAAMGGGPRQQMEKWRALRPVLEQSHKPVALAFLGDGVPLVPNCAAEIAASSVPFFRSPDRALRAFAHVAAYGRWRAAGARRAAAPLLPPIALAGSGPLAEHRGKAILHEIGIAVPRGNLAHDLGAALGIAQTIGYPVVLKGQAASLTHKSDVGAVVTSITDERALGEAWQSIAARLSALRPDLVLDGMLVEAMAPQGVEMIAGARRDPDWGPVLMVGLGGVWTEALGDVRLMPADSDSALIEAEIERLAGARLLKGYRGAPASDVPALVDALSRLGALMRACCAIAEIDINPLRVYPRGQGVLALDALIVMQPR